MTNIQTLKNILDIYGASPDKWPEENRQALTDLLEVSQEAKDLFQEALTLDQAMQTYETPDPNKDILESVMHKINNPVQTQPRHSANQNNMKWYLPAAAVACALIVIITMSYENLTVPATDTAVQTTIASTNSAAETKDIFTLFMNEVDLIIAEESEDSYTLASQETSEVDVFLTELLDIGYEITDPNDLWDTFMN